MRCDTNEIQKLTEEKKSVQMNIYAELFVGKMRMREKEKRLKESEFQLMMMINFFADFKSIFKLLLLILQSNNVLESFSLTNFDF